MAIYHQQNTNTLVSRYIYIEREEKGTVELGKTVALCSCIHPVIPSRVTETSGEAIKITFCRRPEMAGAHPFSASFSSFHLCVQHLQSAV